MNIVRLLYCLTLMLFVFNCQAQDSRLNTFLSKYQNWRNKTVEEKIFVHTDRTAYLTGEIIWLKIYRVEAATLQAIDWSRIAYLEILDRNSIPVLQTKMILNKSGGQGSVFLPTTLTTGNYILRCYTQNMRNSGADSFFYQAITIINPFLPLERGSDTSGSKEKYDAQFLPEGGFLVNDLESVIGVRVVNENGSGIHFSGAILNQKNDTVARFKSSKFGLGKFKFTPLINETYRALLIDEKGKLQTHTFPQVISTGYVMKVEDVSETDIQVTVNSNGVGEGNVYLLAHTRKVLKLTERSRLVDGKAVFRLNKNQLAEGVSCFSIYDENLIPQSERLYYIRPKNQLVINVTGNNTSHGVREKINLNVAIQSNKGDVLDPLISVAVYQADQIDLPIPNINNYFSLTADLHGSVESIDYYFGEESPELSDDIDNLLLTHGWRTVNWGGILGNEVSTVYQPELGGHLVIGKLVDKKSGKPPVDNIPAYLSFMGKPVNVYISRSTQKGNIVFETEPITGNKSMIVQTSDALNQYYRIQIDDPFSTEMARIIVPSFSLSRNQAEFLEQRNIHMQIQSIFHNQPQDSFIYVHETFYNKCDETYQLDDYTRFSTLEEVMREYVPGISVKKQKGQYHLSVIDLINKTVFPNAPLVLVDGVPIFNINQLMELDPLRLKQLDVVGRRYYIGAMAFDGIVSYTSFKGDLAGFQPPSDALLLNYKGMEPQRQFFKPKYDFIKNETIPDVRRVLYWNADMNVSNNVANAEFFTSDIAGDYRIVIQAMSSDGKSAYFSSSFLVK